MRRTGTILGLTLAATLLLGRTDPTCRLVAEAAWSASEPATPPAVPAAPRRSLTLREARALGVTLAAVRKAVEDLRTSGDLDAAASRAEVAALVADRLAEQNAAAFRGAEGLDWDALLAFIEKLLPLILRLLGT